eukprot:XP_011419304.1 PREDICTED: 26S proteasome non-ATPase regulatory subunit 3 [Crassostrea gigas]
MKPLSFHGFLLLLFILTQVKIVQSAPCQQTTKVVRSYQSRICTCRWWGICTHHDWVWRYNEEYKTTCCAGYGGPNCQPICSSGCYGRGTCVAPEQCRCYNSDQYTGYACQTPVCNPRCEHGTCVAPNTCSCHHGYKGRLCNAPVVLTEKLLKTRSSLFWKYLQQALRKAPQHSAVGFKQIVQKLCITVELLMGDIPDRHLFRQPSMRKTLAPYFQLTQAVRTGNLAKFNEVLAKFGAKFQGEDTYTLIIRLRHNVIKTGIRMINLSYSRISLTDIAQKLMLDSPEDAEYIVAKAIRDGVIEANIDHEKGFVQSRETSDVYTTREPMAAFHSRITFCLDIHNHSIKAMRFPPKSYNKDLESAEERREREQQELESAKEIADEDFDGFP